MQVGMQALDMSRVVFSVLPYMSHPRRDISQRASELIARWRDQALRTETLVQKALAHLLPHRQ